MLKPWLVVGLMAVAACDGRALQSGEPVDTSGNSITSSGTTDGGDGSTCAAPPMSSLCSPAPAGLVGAGSMSDLLATLPGRWLLCGHESVFGVDGGDVGLEITADNHWYKLFAAQGAATVRGAGSGEEGTWDALDLGDHIQVDFDILGSGGIATAPLFASTPRAMRLDNNGVFVGNYVIDPTIPMGSLRCPALPDPTRSGDCTPPPDSLVEQPGTDDAARVETAGRWSRCGGSMPGAPLHDGIELTPDGSFYFLHRDTAGDLVRDTSDADHATATLSVGPTDGEISIETLAGASIISGIELYQSTPRQLWIYTGPEWGDPERYTFVSP
jgi:hypothetical protein